MMLHAVIMAGGSGTRFWPASRAKRPKQLLDLVGDRTMIQSTVDRLGTAIPPERVLIVTNESQADAIREQLPNLPADAVLGEPCKRDTAPCIGLAAMQIARDDPEATLVVMPADHVIRPSEKFQDAVRLASELVEQHTEGIVTFGIRPSYPAESFGYIQRGEPVAGDYVAPVFEVQSFREKPKADVAEQYVNSGDYYWNSGIFVWKARTIIDALARHQPKMHAHLQKIAAALGTNSHQDVLRQEFSAIKGISIDYAVMEHATQVLVIEAPFEWDDVGSWQALSRLCGTDDASNTIIGKHLGIETRNTIVRTSEGHLVVTLGIEDCIVVHTPDATLVANRNQEEAVRQIVQQLEKLGWDEFL